MDFIKEQYPQLSEIYFDYLNTNEYAKHPLVEWSQKDMSKVLASIAEEAESNEKKFDDIIILNAVDNELVGFILGFSYALKLIKESDILKEFS